METINAQQLAFILDTTKKEAAKKITVANARHSGNKDMAICESVESNPSIDIKIMGKHLDIDLNFYLSDIKKNFLKNSSTGRWILDYPVEKMKPSKSTGFFPKTISIPSSVRSLLSEDQTREILSKWRETYKEYQEEHGVIFK